MFCFGASSPACYSRQSTCCGFRHPPNQNLEFSDQRLLAATRTRCRPCSVLRRTHQRRSLAKSHHNQPEAPLSRWYRGNKKRWLACQGCGLSGRPGISALRFSSGPCVVRAQKIIELNPSSLRFRRWPVHFGMSAAVKAGEAITGLPPGIRHGDKGDRRVVEGAGRLVV